VQPPPGYSQADTGHARIIALENDLSFALSAVRTAGTLHAYAANTPGARVLQGRGIAYAIPANGVHWLVRHYHRGGAIEALLDARYLSPGCGRPLAEVIVSEAARARGIPTPRVTAAVIYADGIFYRGDIATEFLANAADLAALTLGPSPWADDARVSAWRAAGALLRLCFESGLSHPDINLKNILVERTKAGVAAHIIDLDRAHLGSAATPAERARMLARFERSRLKLERITGRSVRADERQAFGEGLGQ
jgi:3-deoxy-D-manno-octulosonic acid kinase